jgi:hypothetical protein
MYKTWKTNEKGVPDQMKRTDAILVLRNVKSDMTSHNGFKYPRRGWVEAPDWEDTDKCGHGLHGLPWGVGGSGYLYPNDNTIWLVIKVNPADGYQYGTGDMADKCKFRGGYVVFCGCRDEAVQYLLDHGAVDKPVVYCKKTGGDKSTLTGGDKSTLTGGDGSTLTGGDKSTLTGGYGSTLTGGDKSTLTGGDKSTLTGGYGPTLTGGDGSTLTGGDGSTLTGGYGSTLTGGYGSTLTGGDGSTLTGGDGSTLIFRYYDGARFRFVVGYVGENGIMPNVAYQLDENHVIVVAGG